MVDNKVEFIPVKIALYLVVVYFAVLLIGPLGSRFQLWSFRTSFLILRFSVFLPAVAVLGASFGVLVAHLRGGQFMMLSVFTWVGATIGFAIPWYWYYQMRTVPAIHDITTDTMDPPPFVAVAYIREQGTNSLEYGGKQVAEQQEKAYPNLRPLNIPYPPDRVYHEALRLAEALGWEIVDENRVEGRIEATDTTFWFGFKDDIVIRIRDSNGGTRVDARSASRVGRSDLGANAKRIQRFLEHLETRLDRSD